MKVVGSIQSDLNSWVDYYLFVLNAVFRLHIILLVVM
ncbi:hypothetical protein MPF_0259 [Methanohalophilus portucalensis FDF-1]|uniref:Uncharacterized protein n=1 Tax=Methanohalophilus portucalensis FDF-1 TaxID=523843 RepID=A0A1L9C7L7_9EURY|nr:hypothetical protein MPF_0259 [Methanohalophilus portucalensis FDF-1]